MAISEDYAPYPVPPVVNPTLRAYLDNELNRIALLLNEANQSRMYGGLSQIGGQALAVTATPQKLGFTSDLPSQGVLPDNANNEFTITADGNYMLSFFVNSAATGSILMTFEAYRNGIASGRPALSEIITQAAGQSFGAATIISLAAGDVISMFVSGTPNRTVTFDNVNYFAARL